MLDNLKKEHAIIALIIASVIVGGFYFWQSANPWEPIAKNIDEIESAKIAQKLEELKIEHKIANNGEILVKSSDKAGAKLKLTSEKVLGTEAVGLEIFDNLDYGMTEFSQKVHYQRALQGELARSIKAIEGIKYARVHLSTPEKRLFKNDQRRASAAVTVSGSDITNAKLVSIKELVAAAVDNLAPSDVIITDTKGNLFNAKADMSSNISSKLENQALHEERIKEKISNIIGMVAAQDDYNLSVNVEINYNKVNQTNNDFITPDKEIILKRSSLPSGKNSSGQNVEYGYGTKSESIEFSIGEVSRITTGVIITKAMNQSSIESLKKVISDAIGLDMTRGDSISIIVMDVQAKDFDIATTNNTDVIEAVSLSDNKTEQPTEIDGIAADKSADHSILSKATTKDAAIVDDSLSHPFLKQSYLLIALAMMTLLFLMSIIFNRSRRLSGNQREKLLNDVQNWLKE